MTVFTRSAMSVFTREQIGELCEVLGPRAEDTIPTLTLFVAGARRFSDAMRQLRTEDEHRHERHLLRDYLDRLDTAIGEAHQLVTRLRRVARAPLDKRVSDYQLRGVAHHVERDPGVNLDAWLGTSHRLREIVQITQAALARGRGRPRSRQARQLAGHVFNVLMDAGIRPTKARTGVFARVLAVCLEAAELPGRGDHLFRALVIPTVNANR